MTTILILSAIAALIAAYCAVRWFASTPETFRAGQVDPMFYDKRSPRS